MPLPDLIRRGYRRPGAALGLLLLGSTGGSQVLATPAERIAIDYTRLPAGRTVIDTIRSPALANRFGTPAEARVAVYLPPSYDGAPSRRFPVVYLLPGYGATDFEPPPGSGLLSFARTVDAAFAAGAKEMIVVVPSPMTRLGGSFYVNSAATGQWEDFITRDLVAWTDARFRTLARPESRGLAGHSMGGFGTLYLGMRHANVTYGAMYAMSPCCTGSAPFDSTAWSALERTTTLDAWMRLPFPPRATAAVSAAFAPDTTRPPLFFAPLGVRRDGQWVQDTAVARRFIDRTPLLMIPRYGAALATLRGVQVDVGRQDDIVDPREIMRVDSALTRARVPHRFEMFDGDHVNRIGVRLRDAVMPFFSRVLVFQPAP